MDYKYIKAYGKYAGHSDLKIQNFIDKATRENQPENVVTPFNNTDWVKYEHFDKRFQEKHLDL